MKHGATIRSKTVYVFDIAGDLVDEFASISLAAASLGMPATHLYTAVQRGSLMKGTRYASYHEDFVPQPRKANFNPLFKAKFGAKHNPSSLLKKTYIFDLRGELAIIFESRIVAAKALGVTSNHLGIAIRNSHVIGKKWYASYSLDFTVPQKEGRPVYVRDSWTRIIERHESANETMENLSITYGTFQQAVRAGTLVRRRYYLSRTPDFNNVALNL